MKLPGVNYGKGVESLGRENVGDAAQANMGPAIMKGATAISDALNKRADKEAQSEADALNMGRLTEYNRIALEAETNPNLSASEIIEKRMQVDAQYSGLDPRVQEYFDAKTPSALGALTKQVDGVTTRRNYRTRVNQDNLDNLNSYNQSYNESFAGVDTAELYATGKLDAALNEVAADALALAELQGPDQYIAMQKTVASHNQKIQIAAAQEFEKRNTNNAIIEGNDSVTAYMLSGNNALEAGDPEATAESVVNLFETVKANEASGNFTSSQINKQKKDLLDLGQKAHNLSADVNAASGKSDASAAHLTTLRSGTDQARYKKVLKRRIDHLDKLANTQVTQTSKGPGVSTLHVMNETYKTIAGQTPAQLGVDSEAAKTDVLQQIKTSFSARTAHIGEKDKAAVKGVVEMEQLAKGISLHRVSESSGNCYFGTQFMGASCDDSAKLVFGTGLTTDVKAFLANKNGKLPEALAYLNAQQQTPTMVDGFLTAAMKSPDEEDRLGALLFINDLSDPTRQSLKTASNEVELTLSLARAQGLIYMPKDLNQREHNAGIMSTAMIQANQAENMDPHVKLSREQDFDETYKNSATFRTSGDYDDLWENSLESAGFDDDVLTDYPNEMPAFTNQVYKMFRYYKTVGVGGDTQSQLNMAMKTVGERYGESDITGDTQFIEYPPEKYIPMASAGGGDWVGEDLDATLEAAFGMEVDRDTLTFTPVYSTMKGDNPRWMVYSSDGVATKAAMWGPSYEASVEHQAAQLRLKEISEGRVPGAEPFEGKTLDFSFDEGLTTKSETQYVLRPDATPVEKKAFSNWENQNDMQRGSSITKALEGIGTLGGLIWKNVTGGFEVGDDKPAYQGPGTVDKDKAARKLKAVEYEKARSGG